MIGSSKSWARCRNWRSGTMTLPSPAARSVEVRAEVDRLNGIFSLFRDDSEISRLNRDGYLDNPSWELRDQLTAGRQFSELSDGAFDISVQPLWQLYAAHFWTGTDKSADIDAAAQDVAERLVDYRLVDIGPRRISLGRPGYGRHAEFDRPGFCRRPHRRHAGRARICPCLCRSRRDQADRRPSSRGRPWRIGLRDPKDQATLSARMLDLEDIGLAVSGGYGTTI